MDRSRTATMCAVAASVMCLLGSASGGAAATVSPPTSETAPSPGRLFVFADPRIDESSGLETSSRPGVFFTHNDSGDSARFFAVDERGETIGVYNLPGAHAVDWEDIARATANGRQVLYLGDIGDNKGTRAEVAVYEVAEPSAGTGPGGADVRWTRYRLRYADGPRDAEALMVDPRDGRLYVASKSLLGQGTLYVAPERLSATSVNVLRPVRPVPPLVTAGDFTPDGERLALLTYAGAFVADDITGPWRTIDGVPLGRQVEALAVTDDGTAVLVGSEGVHSPVYKVPLPPPGDGDATSTGPAPSPGPTGAAADPASRGGGAAHGEVVVTVAIGAGVLALLAAAWTAVRSLRARRR